MTTIDFTERLLAEGESQRIEFKSSAEGRDAIARNVCAFLNSDGGIVIAGVEEDGKPNRTATQEQADRLRKFLLEQITPKALLDVSFDHTPDGNVITVSAPAGPDRPYVFEGAVYVRRGATTQPATAQVLRAMVEDNRESATRWERRPSMGFDIEDVHKALLEETVRRAQEGRGLRLDNPREPLSVLMQLSLLQSGQLTNAADVLFGKTVARRHPQTRLRAVSYATDRAGDFLDLQLYEGPAFRLLEDAMAFLRRNLRVVATFPEGQLTRESRPEYPFDALREGLVNALVHRDYAAFSGGVSLSIYPDRIEIWNTGRLPRGISPRDLLLASHPSILVNPDIGHVFYLHELMERVGRGTYKIAQECRSLGLRVPEWKNVGAGVRLTLYAAGSDRPARIDFNDRQRALLDALEVGEQIRVPDYVERFGHGITTRQARRDLSELEGYGLLVRHGAGPRTAYARTKQAP